MPENTRILLIGFGAMGNRHFQSILKIKPKIDVKILDKKIKTKRLNDLLIKFDKYGIDNLPNQIDIGIFATKAKNREETLNQLTETIFFKNIILEKNISDNLVNFVKINELINKLSKTKIYVNLWLRDYKELNKILSKKDKLIHATITFNDQSFLTNAIHFLDFINLFWNTKKIKLQSHQLLKFKSGKRSHTAEITGNLDILYENFGKLKVIIPSGKRNKNGEILLKLTFLHATYKIIFEINRTVVYIDDKKFAIIPPYLQSQRGQITLKKLLMNESINLPNYQEIKHIHFFLLNELEKLFYEINKYSKKEFELA